MHMLVFLKDMRQIRLKTIRGDIPWSTPELAHEVHSRQHSDEGVLPKHDGPSELLNVNGQPCLRLHHPKKSVCYQSKSLYFHPFTSFEVSHGCADVRRECHAATVRYIVRRQVSRQSNDGRPV